MLFYFFYNKNFIYFFYEWNFKFSFLEKVDTDIGPSPVARGVEILGITWWLWEGPVVSVTFS